MAIQKKSLLELCNELSDEFGKTYYRRIDKKVTQEIKDAIMNAAKDDPEKIGEFKVIDINHRDGFKFIFNEGWLLIRASGTEPLLRFYSEADSMENVNKILQSAMSMHN